MFYSAHVSIRIAEDGRHWRGSWFHESAELISATRVSDIGFRRISSCFHLLRSFVRWFCAAALTLAMNASGKRKRACGLSLAARSEERFFDCVRRRSLETANETQRSAHSAQNDGRGQMLPLLRTQTLQDGERGFFGALGLFSCGAYAGGTAVFAGACCDQFLRAAQEQIVDAIERLAEAYAAGICVIDVQIRLEEFSGCGTIADRAGKFLPLGFDSCAGRALADGRAEIAAVAHQEQGGHRFQRVEQAENSALAVGKREGKGFQQFAIKCDPEGGGVHFVFGEVEFSVAYVFIGEEFYFLEADDLGTDENVSVGTGGVSGSRREIPRCGARPDFVRRSQIVGTLRSE